MSIMIDSASFLNIHYENIIVINNIPFYSVFHYIEAMKRTSYEEYLLISQTKEIDDVKSLISSMDTRLDWDNIKYSILEYALFEKYRTAPLLQKLLETGIEDIIDPNDQDNVIGELTMKARRYYISLQGCKCESYASMTPT